MFVPRDMNLSMEYESGWKVTDAFPVNVLGFQTHRDHFAVDFSKTALRKRIEDLRGPKSDEELRALYQLSDNRDWQLSAARKQVRSDKEWERHFIQCLYRPFDRRHCYFSTVAMDYPRRELLDHVAGRKNLCLLSSRQQATLGYKHCWVAREPANDCVISTTSREANQVFPLYAFTTGNGQAELEVQIPQRPQGVDGRRPNLSPEFIVDMEKRLGLKFVPDGKGDICGTGVPPVGEHGLEGHATSRHVEGVSPVSEHALEGHATAGHGQDAHATTFGPEDVFNYIYGVFHSPTYRSRYAEFLKSDFPRIPLTSDVKLFRTLCSLGSELVALHLLESPALQNPIARYPVKGSNIVEKGFPKIRCSRRAGAGHGQTA
jgi:predicted helicase